MPTTKKKVKRPVPKIMIVAIDATDAYSEELVKRCGRVADVYFYNQSEVTNCCELTPSYWLEYVCSYAEVTPNGDKEREEIYDLLDEANIHTEGRYMNCRKADAIALKLRDFSQEDILDMGDQDLNDYVREYVRPDEFYANKFLPWER